ncbi:MAG: YicC family protein [Oligoflexia bacterium]|nr:YicC family protein [Oligoflexia bacterium]
MALSMTGFGVATIQTQKNQLTVQVKSVNGRFLETKFKLPKAYFSFENDLRQVVADNIFRGSVEILVNKSEFAASHLNQTNVVFNEDLAKAWLSGAVKLSKKLKLKYAPEFRDVLKIPDLYQVNEDAVLTDDERNFVIKALKQALKDCIKSKNSEGEKLTKNLLHLVGELEDFAQNVEKMRPEMEKQLKQNLEKKIKELSQTHNFDETRLMQESVYLVEKADIEEELTRLKAHIQSFKKILNEKAASVGKKLDFITQEMHREINTMGAKTQSLQTINNVINAKAFVEKIREQVQNIE